LIVVLLGVLASAELAYGDEGGSIAIGRSMVALQGPWKFHTGDLPAWAGAKLDDSAWESVDMRAEAGAMDPTGGQSGYVPGWSAKGHPGYWGYGWYRLHVKLEPSRGTKLAIFGPNDLDDVYQLYWDGVLLGSFGNFSYAQPKTYNAQPAMFELPAEARRELEAHPGAEHVLAFRVWMDRTTLEDTPDAGGMHTAPSIGEAGVVTAIYQNNWLSLLRAVALNLVATAMFLLLGAGCVCLIFFDRSDDVYLWMGGVLLLAGTFGVAVSMGSLTQWISIPTERVFADVVYVPLSAALWVMVWWRWFRFERPRWLPYLVVGLSVLLAVINLLSLNLWFAVSPSVNALLTDVSVGLRLSLFVVSLTIVWFAIRYRGTEAWLVLVPLLLSGVSRFEPELAGLGLPVVWFPYGVTLDLAFITQFCQVLVLAVLLIRRVYRSVIEQRRKADDIKQAQEVQQVILSDTKMSFPGFDVECEYRPAREVGGDFFQILPHCSDGSLLVVAGDVTGKGLKAGMVVALLVGAIRTAAETSDDPRYVLEVLNRRLIGRGDSYATCLAMRIEADGSAVLANAGHLPPYCNDRAMEVEGSLPLGMIDGIEFPLMRFHLKDGDRLTLISDGIIEATDARGNLFGFERTGELLANPISAGELATAAQKFGQDDDISVICVTRVAEFDQVLV